MLARSRRCPKTQITTKCLHFGDNVLFVVINAVRNSTAFGFCGLKTTTASRYPFDYAQGRLFGDDSKKR